MEFRIASFFSPVLPIAVSLLRGGGAPHPTVGVKIGHVVVCLSITRRYWDSTGPALNLTPAALFSVFPNS
jgi:hypothetical protein